MSKMIEAFANRPVREDFESDEEFAKALVEWEENQTVPRMSEHDWDAEHGPAFDENLNGPHPDHGYADDVEHGPGVEA